MGPSPGFCTKKEWLTDLFIKAVSEYNRSQSAQVAALRNGEGMLFEDQVKAARDQRDAARDALLMHRQQHGC